MFIRVFNLPDGRLNLDFFGLKSAGDLPGPYDLSLYFHAPSFFFGEATDWEDQPVMAEGTVALTLLLELLLLRFIVEQPCLFVVYNLSASVNHFKEPPWKLEDVKADQGSG